MPEVEHNFSEGRFCHRVSFAELFLLPFLNSLFLQTLHYQLCPKKTKYKIWIVVGGMDFVNRIIDAIFMNLAINPNFDIRIRAQEEPVREVPESMRGCLRGAS